MWPLDFQIQKRVVSAETIWGNMLSVKFGFDDWKRQISSLYMVKIWVIYLGDLKTGLVEIKNYSLYFIEKYEICAKIEKNELSL